MKMSSFLLVNLVSLIHAFQVNDFQIGVQLCGLSGGENVGVTRHTPWLKNGAGWSSWASNNGYKEPHGMRIGIWGRHNTAGDEEFALEDTDIRFCIRLSDDVTHEYGNVVNNGRTQCTAWASSGGGWSDWAGDNNWADFNAAKVRIQTQYQPGLLITDIRTGIRLTDQGTSSAQMGYSELTEWLIGAQISTQSWSGWAGDDDFFEPDAVKIFLGVQMSLGNTWETKPPKWEKYDKYHRKYYHAEDQDEMVDENNKYAVKMYGYSMGIFEIVIICIVGLLITGCITVVVYRCCKNKKNEHVPVYLDDSDDEFDDENVDVDVVTDIELEGIKESEYKSTIST